MVPVLDKRHNFFHPNYLHVVDKYLDLYGISEVKILDKNKQFKQFAVKNPDKEQYIEIIATDSRIGCDLWISKNLLNNIEILAWVSKMSLHISLQFFSPSETLKIISKNEIKIMENFTFWRRSANTEYLQELQF